jgi:hypothetical protein
MNTLTVELKDKTFKGEEAITVLTALLARGYRLSPNYILWDELDRPAGTLRYIQKGRSYQSEVIGQLSYMNEDSEAGDIINAIELGFKIANRQKQVKPKIKVMEVA